MNGVLYKYQSPEYRHNSRNGIIVTKISESVYDDQVSCRVVKGNEKWKRGDYVNCMEMNLTRAHKQPLNT